LLFGVAISYAFRFHFDWFAKVSSAHRLWMIVGGCAAFVPAFVLTLERSPFIYTAGLSLFYLGGGALLIAILLSGATENRAAILVGMIGSYSYSIYLWHMPVLNQLPHLLGRILHFELSFALQVPVCIFVSVAGGVIMARLIEAPALRLRDRWFPARIQSVQDNPARGSRHAGEEQPIYAYHEDVADPRVPERISRTTAPDSSTLTDRMESVAHDVAAPGSS